MVKFKSLKGRRIELGLTQEDVAKSINISRKTLSNIEKHLTIPSLIDTINLCRIYELKIKDMLILLRIDNTDLF